MPTLSRGDMGGKNEKQKHRFVIPYQGIASGTYGLVWYSKVQHKDPEMSIHFS